MIYDVIYIYMHIWIESVQSPWCPRSAYAFQGMPSHRMHLIKCQNLFQQYIAISPMCQCRYSIHYHTKEKMRTWEYELEIFGNSKPTWSSIRGIPAKVNRYSLLDPSYLTDDDPHGGPCFPQRTMKVASGIAIPIRCKMPAVVLANLPAKWQLSGGRRQIDLLYLGWPFQS